MAQDKTWSGSESGDYSDADNWLAIGLVNGTYKWTGSGSGTNEFFLEILAGGDPGIDEPASVQANGSDMTAGSAGTLAAGAWDWADNDTLGYSTVYVRLADGANPGSKTINYVTYRAIPVAGDHVRLPAGAAAITSGLDQSAVALGDFIVEDGFSQTIASSLAPLRIRCSYFKFSGGGTAYIDLGTSSNVPVEVFNTAGAANGQRGLYLQGSSIDVATVHAGNVGFAVQHGESATVSKLRVVGGNADVWMGEGSSLATLAQLSGTVRLRVVVTNLNLDGGTCYTEEQGGFGTANAKAGLLVINGTGTMTTLTLAGATLDEKQSGADRTIGTVNFTSGTIRRNTDAVTHTTFNPPTDPCEITARLAA